MIIDDSGSSPSDLSIGTVKSECLAMATAVSHPTGSGTTRASISAPSMPRNGSRCYIMSTVNRIFQVGGLLKEAEFSKQGSSSVLEYLLTNTDLHTMYCCVLYCIR